jgi:hypothetical protein
MPPPAPTWHNPPANVTSSESYSRDYMMRHWLISCILAVSLIIVLGGIYTWDNNAMEAIAEAPPLPTPIPPTPPPSLRYEDPVVGFSFTEDGRFGLFTTIGDPDRSDDNDKRLTFSPDGGTNNTRIYVDGTTPLYGGSDGRFIQEPTIQDAQLLTTWVYQAIQVQQIVHIVSSPSTRLLDTLQIEYRLENLGDVPREVGLRLMIDTLIGSNDGVPFVVPGRSGIVDQATTLFGSEIPDFIQALEKTDLVNPGVIVNLTLRGGEATPPDRVDLAGWHDYNAGWDIIAPVGGMGAPLRRNGISSGEPDSAVALYYQPAPLHPGESRRIVAFYGLGAISSTESGNPSLSLTFARQATVGDSFWIVAIVFNPVEGQNLQLTLPSGLSLVEGHTAEKSVVFDFDDYFTQVSWLVRANDIVENGEIVVTLWPNSFSETQTVTVTSRGITR